MVSRQRHHYFLPRLPAPEVLEAHTVRFVGFGFIFWTTTIGVGAIWANPSRVGYWGWDPIESWALIIWLAYAVLLHARLLFKLNARATAWGTLARLGISVVTALIFPFVFPCMYSAYFQ